MKTYLKIIALLCLMSLMLTASAQCPTGDVVLLSQEDVNEFGMLYPDCTELQGNLLVGAVSGNTPPTNIADLSPFGGITYIGGDLIIGKGDPAMTLLGLSSLDSIGENLRVNYNSTLASFVGLENVQTIGYGISVGTAPVSDFTGLNNLQSIGGTFHVRDIINFTGLENLNTIQEDFDLEEGLSSFQGLENLATIGGGIFVRGYQSFTDFSGLENLTTIGGEFSIVGEAIELSSFVGLENLTVIGGDFNVHECEYLNSFSDLENLNTIEGSLEIHDIHTDNINLPALSAIGHGIYIHNSSLNSLTGLENLTDFGNLPVTNSSLFGSYLIPGEIRLVNNSTLADISAINHLTIDTLTITENPNLSVCSIESICEYLVQGGTATIENNAGGCNTVEEIMQSCGVQCPPGDVVLLSQEEVNEFGTLYPNCTELPGNLQIGTDSGGAADITDLNPLNNITSIAGDFTSIETISLVGLENLTTIGGRLDVNVESFQGLNGLTTIGGWLFVSENNPVQNFIGLESLTSIGNRLRLDENCCISSFVGLENLSYIGDNLWIDSECNCINSFSGLESLTTIEGNLQIAGVTAADFTGLNNLSTIGGSIHLNQSGMNSLSGLENVTVFGNNASPWPLTTPGQIVLENNSVLTDISAISHLPISNLRLQNNENLSVCNMENICEYFAQGGIGMTENNAEGCNTINEIVESCGFDCPPTVVCKSEQAVLVPFLQPISTI